MLMKIQTVIHPSSVIEAGAKIGEGVRVGPFCHISADAVIGDRVELVSHVSVMGATIIGASTKVYPMATLGAPPQNTKHKGGRTTLVLGENCTIREGVTMHLGTDSSRGETTIGDNGNNVYIGGLTAVHQFVRVGDNAFLGGCSAIVGDVIPYAIAVGNRASLRG